VSYLQKKYKAVWLVLFLAVITITLTNFYSFYANLPNPWLRKIEYSAQILARDGQRLRMFTSSKGYWCFPVDINQLDKRYLKALISYEDQRFYQHNGVDVISLVRAVFQLVSEGRVISGASTLSMQTVRLLQPVSRTLKNKLVEMLQAWRMESQLSKQEILNIYLSLAPYGGNIQGITAASYFYFGKTPKRLTTSEIALLIALPQAPETRRPDRHPIAARYARSQVLLRLNEANIIDRQQLQLATKQAIPRIRTAIPFVAPHFAERMKRKAQEKKDYRLITSLDYPLQLKVQKFTENYQKQLPPGETLAILIVDNDSRQILAHMGSGNYWQASQIDLSRSVRSPGSALKPLIYGLGFEQKLFHPQTWVMDQPLRMNDGYGPQNFDGQYHGQVNLITALQKSLNVPAIKALNRVGAKTLVTRLQSLGVVLQLPKNQDPGLPIALGGAGIRLQDLVALYSAIANRGSYQPLSLLAVDEQNFTPGIKLLSPQASWYLDFVLQGVPVPQGYEQQEYDKIRFKTGTSYGYRDVWSIGYNNRYTIGVWRGRPDGGFTQNSSGLSYAAPLLFQLFDFLPPSAAQPRVADKPDNVDLPGVANLPINMQWLAKDANRFLADNPIIQYPLDGSIIEVQDSQQQILLLKAQAGTPPYYWLVNGQFQSHHGDGSQYQWPITGKGPHRITLIDSLGKQSSSEVTLK